MPPNPFFIKLIVLPSGQRLNLVLHCSYRSPIPLSCLSITEMSFDLIQAVGHNLKIWAGPNRGWSSTSPQGIDVVVSQCPKGLITTTLKINFQPRDGTQKVCFISSAGIKLLVLESVCFIALLRVSTLQRLNLPSV